ncbi:23S rRNA (cytidine1920-2'-O)/16S rRNA (cytidine1409-2'-O)-methyltransferase [Fulvimarina manganoxydans]|uniref:23S rRNA (Cytidine1920-2'-O)/16S rRNA (Cytidine1409-2'-O)-methyltransferase n=2 Tax=Fulvimarina manganoxydans TaxID=937218 RepID=A0A1W2CJN3_9HYPH|nr:23S rRNA (cytidine1920-2'-O)/16S rRNA (cytidine1409-2'-O)-methyltransferase [Fulvimarina manganoxydans]
MRLDLALVERGLYGTRSRARDAVLRGTVRVDGVVATKASVSIAPDAWIEIDDPAGAYVSRAALKLIAGLDVFGLDPAGLSCLDIGLSTGGFAQVLLERGAAHVTGIDVGHGQVDTTLATHPRLTAIEGLNARELTAGHLGDRPVEFVTSDVSFISVTLALPPALALAEPGAKAVLLVKPQFEAGREAIGKGGLLKDPSMAESIAARLRDWLGQQAGWRAPGLAPSPIEGGDGNREFLLVGEKTG